MDYKACFYCKEKYNERDSGPPFCEKHLEEYHNLIRQMGLTPDYLLPQDDRSEAGLIQTSMSNSRLTLLIMKYAAANGQMDCTKARLLYMDALYAEHYSVVKQIRKMFHLETEPHFILNEWNRLCPDYQVLPEEPQNVMP